MSIPKAKAAVPEMMKNSTNFLLYVWGNQKKQNL